MERRIDDRGGGGYGSERGEARRRRMSRCWSSLGESGSVEDAEGDVGALHVSNKRS